MAASDDQNRLNSERTQDSELEQYGVWVKAGPEDVDESEAEDEAFTLTDLGDDELDEAEMEILGVDEELSKEPNEFDESIELDLGEPLELDEAEESVEPVDEAAPDTLEPDESTQYDDGLLTIEDDDLAMPLEEEAEELGLDDLDLSEAEPLPAEPVDEAEGDDDLLELSTDEDVVGGIDIDDELPGSADDLTLDLSSLDVDAYDEPTTGEDAQQPDDETAELEDEIDLEEPIDLESPLDLESEDEIALASAGDTEPAPEIENAEAVLENEDLDLDSLDLGDDTEVAELDLSSLPTDEDDFAALGDTELGQLAEDDLPELEVDDELDLDTGGDLAEPDEFETSLELDESFDDLGAVEDELFGEPEAPAEREPSEGTDARSLSLLESIERELSSIRTELSSLKDELSTLRSTPSQAPHTATEPIAEDDEAAGGFFEDEGDDDETIALTGAELDNIMNTAEFTEEAGEPTEFDEFIQTAPPAEESNPLQEITLDEAPEDLGPIDLDLDTTPTEPEDAGADLFGASEDAVEALAGLDIDAELADIEELEDKEIAEEQLDITMDEESAIETELDEEPLEDLEIDVEPESEMPLATDSAEDGELVVEDLDVSIEEDTMDEPLPTDTPLDDLADLGAAVPPADTPIPENLKGELRSVLNYMDKLLDSLPEEKIQEFAASDHFKVYKRLFEELGLEQ